MFIQFCQCPHFLPFSRLAMSRPKHAPEGLVSVTSAATPIPASKPMSIGIGREFALVNQLRAISSPVSRLR